jgi:hypothetical protein
MGRARPSARAPAQTRARGPTCRSDRTSQEPSMRLHYAIVFVTDMQRSLAFYRDVLGIPLRFESPE